MKTTLEIDDNVMRELKARAAHDGTTMSALVESALRLLLQGEPSPKKLAPLPSWDGGPYLIDVTDRSALDAVLDADERWIDDLSKRRGS